MQICFDSSMVIRQKSYKSDGQPVRQMYSLKGLTLLSCLIPYMLFESKLGKVYDKSNLIDRQLIMREGALMFQIKESQVDI